MRSIVAFAMWGALFFIVAACFSGGAPSWVGHLVSAFAAALFATFWAIDR